MGTQDKSKECRRFTNGVLSTESLRSPCFTRSYHGPMIATPVKRQQMSVVRGLDGYRHTYTVVVGSVSHQVQNRNDMLTDRGPSTTHSTRGFPVHCETDRGCRIYSWLRMASRKTLRGTNDSKVSYPGWKPETRSSCKVSIALSPWLWVWCATVVTNPL